MAWLVTFNGERFKPVREHFVHVTRLSKEKALIKSRVLKSLSELIKIYNNRIKKIINKKKQHKKVIRRNYSIDYYKKNFKEISNSFINLWHKLYLNKELTKVFLEKSYQEIPEEKPEKLYYIIDLESEQETQITSLN